MRAGGVVTIAKEDKFSAKKRRSAMALFLQLNFDPIIAIAYTRFVMPACTNVHRTRLKKIDLGA